MSTKEEVRSRLRLSDVISEHVGLTSMGNGRYRGLCPFHNEKTPSFNVDDNRGFYHCFGCKASGDVFKFVQEIEGLEFFEVLQKLAQRAGVELERRTGQSKQRTDAFEANEFALKYFKDHLTETERAYLHGRGISDESIQKWEIGYAPAGWDGLLSKIKTLRQDVNAFIEAGLIRKADSGRLYDHFRGRLMFPIKDRMGRIVGFGGRDMIGDKAKYVNTPETAHFKKSKLLYGLREAGKNRPSEIIVVEGYMDVIAMHQHGFQNAVASLGTALTADHAAELQRMDVSALTLMFDSDEAGQKATLAGLNQAIGRNFITRVAAVHGGKDPADVLLETGRTSIERALAEAKDEVSFRVEAAIERHGIATPEQKRAVLNELLPRLQSNDPFDNVVGLLLNLLAERLDMEFKMLESWVKAQKRPQSTARTAALPVSGNDRQSILELGMLHSIANEPLLAGKLDKEVEWQNPMLQHIAKHGYGIKTHHDLVAIFEGTPFYNNIIGILHESSQINLIHLENIQQHSNHGLERSLISFEDATIVKSIDQLEARCKAIEQELTTAPAEQKITLLQELTALKLQIIKERSGQ